MEHLSKAQRDTLWFRIGVAAIAMAGALLLFYAAYPRVPLDEPAAPSVPAGDSPPPSRL